MAAVLILTSGCAQGDELKASEEPPSEQEVLSRLFRQIDDQLQQPRYPFTLLIRHFQFEGMQEGKDWSLESRNGDRKKSRIRVVKKGETISLTRGKQTEKMNTRQFGVLSPRDHLLLVKSAVLHVQPLPERQKDWTGMEAVLSSEEIGDQLGEWMGESFEQGPANQASRKFRVRYRFWFHSDQKGLSHLNIKILPLHKDLPREEMVYRFGKP